MFAIVAIKGKQYTVREGETLYVDRIEAEKGAQIEIPEVLLRADEEGKKVELGAPYLKKAVTLEVLGEEKDDKVVVFKMKSKKRYRLTKGHRQIYTAVKVLSIG